MTTFTTKELQELKRKTITEKGRNGQVTVVGGSKLFHGAPVLALAACSRLVDMVFFASPEKTLSKVAAQIKAKLASFIWVPWGDVEIYIAKSDVILIGPGFMRGDHKGETKDAVFHLTKQITEKLLVKFPDKRWVIDGGSLQVIEPDIIPKAAVITPNLKEFKMLFGDFQETDFGQKVVEMAKKYECIIAGKNTAGLVVSDGAKSYSVPSSGVPLTGGGTGDVFSGLVAGLLAKNPSLLAAAAAGFLVQKASESLYQKTGEYFNSDDLAAEVGRVWKEMAGR